MSIPKNRPYIIGETAFHHEGDRTVLEKLIEDIAAMDLDAIKFHLLIDLNEYITPDHPIAAPLSKWLFSSEIWTELLRSAGQKGLDVVALCNDVASIDLIEEHDLPVTAIEIHATGINEIPLLNAAAKSTRTVMIGIGGSSEEEVAFAINVLKERGKEDVILMHGFQNYPTDHALLDLGRIERYSKKFGKQMGFADHTDPSDPENELVSVLGLLQGANVIEKHYTPWPKEERIDHQAAISKDQMLRLKFLADLVWKAKGTGVDILSEAEKKYGAVGPMKKAIVARKNIAAGHSICEEDLAYKRTEIESRLQQKDHREIIGRTTLNAIKENEIIDLSMLN